MAAAQEASGTPSERKRRSARTVPHQPQYSFSDNFSSPPPSASRHGASMTLNDITQLFLSYIRRLPDPENIDLNDFCTEYQVTKRRIYDITNVMEGVELLEKRNKNILAWMGGTPGEPAGNDDVPDEAIFQRRDAAQRELDSIITEEKDLDKYIDMIRNEQYGDKLYLPFATIRENYNPQETLLGIRAPRGTMLEVPDPDEDMPAGRRRFQAYLSTPGVDAGIITFHVIHHDHVRDSALPPQPPQIPHNPFAHMPRFMPPPAGTMAGPPHVHGAPIPPPGYPYMHPHMMPGHHPPVMNHPMYGMQFPPGYPTPQQHLAAAKAASDVISGATAVSKKRKLQPKTQKSQSSPLQPQAQASMPPLPTQQMIPAQPQAQPPVEDRKVSAVPAKSPTAEQSSPRLQPVNSLTGTPPRAKKDITGTPPRRTTIAELETPIRATPLRNVSLFSNDFQSPNLSLLETPNANINLGSFQESPMTMTLQSPVFSRLGRGNHDDFFDQGFFSKSFESKDPFECKDEDASSP
uniref:E2F/DP family winged-helix DNA-binding domain-containing protein n=1 Tax=Leptocylindrus danicus TaxID=163516 RepID=A0A7S2NXS2_9STRA